MILEIRVKPGSRKSGVERAEDGSVTVHVKEPPDKGRANQAVIALLAKEYGVSKCDIEIITPTARRKKIRIKT